MHRLGRQPQRRRAHCGKSSLLLSPDISRIKARIKQPNYQAFHPSSRYLLSGGHDNAICLWALPESLINPPSTKTPTQHPLVLTTPHFRSTALHTNFIDSLAFHADLILSRSAEEHRILLWKITNFSGWADPPPLTSQALQNDSHGLTRSAFVDVREGDEQGHGYQLLMQFATPDSGPFYMRFSLFSQAGQRPVLAFGNSVSKVFLWDLQRLEDGGVAAPFHSADNNALHIPGHKRGRKPLARQRESSTVSTTTTSTNNLAPPPPLPSSASNLSRTSSTPTTTNSTDDFSLPTGAASETSMEVRSGTRDRRYDVSDPFQGIKAHTSVTVPKVSFCARQCAWSDDGRWLVVVGDYGMVALFRR